MLNKTNLNYSLLYKSKQIKKPLSQVFIRVFIFQWGTKKMAK